MLGIYSLSGLFQSLWNLAGTSAAPRTPNRTPLIKVAPPIAKFMGPTWGPPGSCRPQMGPMLAPWTLLSWTLVSHWSRKWCHISCWIDRHIVSFQKKEYLEARCCFNVVSFLPKSYNRHNIARPWGRNMGCFLWIQYLIYILLPPLLSVISWYKGPRYNGARLSIVWLYNQVLSHILICEVEFWCVRQWIFKRQTLIITFCIFHWCNEAIVTAHRMIHYSAVSA